MNTFNSKIICIKRIFTSNIISLTLRAPTCISQCYFAAQKETSTFPPKSLGLLIDNLVQNRMSLLRVQNQYIYTPKIWLLLLQA